MKSVKLSIVIITVILFSACSSIMLKVGEIVQKKMQEKTASLEGITLFVKIANYNRARDLLELEKEYAKKNGIEAQSVGSHVSVLITKGLKFVELDGEVSVNNIPLNYYGSGQYLNYTEVNINDNFNFSLKTSTGETASLEENFSGEKLEVSEPLSNSTLDISNGFTVKWTPEKDQKGSVKVSMIVSQIGIKNILPVGIFPDTGEAFISPQLIGELATTGQKIVTGETTIIVERQIDEIRYILNEDCVTSFISGDSIKVNLTGQVAKAKTPYIESFNTETDIPINVSATLTQKNLTKISDIKNFGLASFVIKGVTAGETVDKTTAGNVEITTTHTWSQDFGEENLVNLANTMATLFEKNLADTINANPVSSDSLINTKGYAKMNTFEQESDSSGFYITARDLTSFEVLKQFVLKVGGPTSWYYDIAKSSNSDIILEVYFNLYRHEPKEPNEFTFDVSVDVVAKSFADTIVMPYHFPTFSAKWTSESFILNEDTTIGDMVNSLKYSQYLDAFSTAISELAKKQ